MNEELCPTCNKFMDYTTNSYVCTGCGKAWRAPDLLNECRKLRRDKLELLGIQDTLDKNLGQLRRELAEMKNAYRDACTKLLTPDERARYA